MRELPGEPRQVLYHPYRTQTTAGPVTMVFRDRELSDAIGFLYASKVEKHAVGQFLDRVRLIRDAIDRPSILSFILMRKRVGILSRGRRTVSQSTVCRPCQ